MIGDDDDAHRSMRVGGSRRAKQRESAPIMNGGNDWGDAAAIEADGQRLAERVRALRRLPPGTPLPLPDGEAEQQLLGDLLLLPDSVDPLRWLQVERGNIAAQIALRRALGRLRRRISQLQRRRRMRGAVTRAEEDVFGGLADGLPDTADMYLLDGAAEVSIPADQLRRLLRAFHTARGQPAPVLPPGPDLAPSSDLVPELLLLPDTTDPLRWLEEERGLFTAVEALRELLARHRPPLNLSVGEPMKTLNPHQHVRAAGIDILIDTVVFGETGISVTARATIATRRIRKPRGVRLLSVEWDGFDDLFDDLGYHYLRQNRRLSNLGGALGWRWHEYVEVFFYPAIAQDATQVTFASNPAIAEVFGWRHSERRRLALEPLHLGSIAWSTRVPR